MYIYIYIYTYTYICIYTYTYTVCISVLAKPVKTYDPHTWLNYTELLSKHPVTPHQLQPRSLASCQGSSV